VAVGLEVGGTETVELQPEKLNVKAATAIHPNNVTIFMTILDLCKRVTFVPSPDNTTADPLVGGRDPALHLGYARYY